MSRHHKGIGVSISEDLLQLVKSANPDKSFSKIVQDALIEKYDFKIATDINSGVDVDKIELDPVLQSISVAKDRYEIVSKEVDTFLNSLDKGVS